MRSTTKKEMPIINPLVKIAFNSLKSQKSLIGKNVVFNGDQNKNRGKQLETNTIYTIKELSIGNYDGFIYLEELPQERYSEYSRKTVPNCFDIKAFSLVHK